MIEAVFLILHLVIVNFLKMIGFTENKAKIKVEKASEIVVKIAAWGLGLGVVFLTVYYS